MASIQYTSIINAWVSTEGSNGMMTNYVYYSLLVVYDNGTREIVQGKDFQIQSLLSYVRTPMDEIDELKKAVKDLRKDINDIADQKVRYAVESMFPIPDVLNMNEDEAKQKIREAGLTPLPVNVYPEGTPHTGVVQSYVRKADNFRQVELNIIHVIPDVEGKTEAEAVSVLRDLGFSVSVEKEIVSGKPDGTAFSCTREKDSSLSVKLKIAVQVPETSGMPVQEAISALESRGFEVHREDQYSSVLRGKVIRWQQGRNEREIILRVSAGTEITEAVHVQVEGRSAMGGNKYSASVKYNGTKHLIEILLDLTLGNSGKHTMTGIAYKSVSGEGNPEILNPVKTLNPNETTRVSVLIPYYAEIGKLPDGVSFTLETQYGLIKKTDDPIDLTFTFEW